MKIWFDWNDNTYSDCNIKLGIGWFRHHEGYNWWGLTVEIYLIKRSMTITYVDNYNEYDRKINYRKYK